MGADTLLCAAAWALLREGHFFLEACAPAGYPNAMRILLTGSSGWLGRHLAPKLLARGDDVVGLDVVPGPFTTILGSVADRATVATAMSGIDAVVAGGALHKPDIVRYPASDFIAVNVEGTQNLLEEAIAAGVGRFVFTSTTSLMISHKVRAGKAGGATAAVWMTEDMPVTPRNIYGITKLAAEHLCRLAHVEHKLNVIVLRTARFFPEEDDMAHAITQSSENTKANEMLFRRLAADDAAQAHVVALDGAPEIGFDIFIVSAPTPFGREDCAELIADAPAVVARYFPDYPTLYATRGWTMFDHIDRVYCAERIERRLGFRCQHTFADVLRRLGDRLHGQ